MDLQEGRERAKGCLFVVVIIGCFCKIALLCNWALRTNVVCVFIKHILKYSFLQSRNAIFKCVHTYLFFCAGPQAGEC